MPESFHSTISLPEEPLIKIRPRRPWSLIDFRDVWSHRELFALLVWRDLKGRYKQTILGAMWVILQPLLMTLVFTIFLGKLVRVQTGATPYPLFLYAGLLPWTFFSNAVSSGSYSLLASSQMITKVYLPRLIIPAAAVTVRLSDFLVASVVLIIFMRYYGIHLGWQILLLPAMVLELTLLALALSALLSALNVKFRDTGTALPVMLQVWMFASPIIYPASLIPERWRWTLLFNPLAGIVEGHRAALLGRAFDRTLVVSSIVVTFVALAAATIVFRRMEKSFADVI